MLYDWLDYLPVGPKATGILTDCLIADCLGNCPMQPPGGHADRPATGIHIHNTIPWTRADWVLRCGVGC